MKRRSTGRSNPLIEELPKRLENLLRKIDEAVAKLEGVQRDLDEFRAGQGEIRRLILGRYDTGR